MRKAQTRQIKLNVYEKHHVFPKSIYGKESAFCFECPEGYYKGRTMAPRRPKI